jgi:hypothetical protein
MKKLALLFLSFALAACIGPTPYQAKGRTGGYSQTRLAGNIFVIYFSGNVRAGRERVDDFLLLRASEVTLAEGYAYFIIGEEDNYDTQTQHALPATMQTTFYGNTATSTITGGQSFMVSKPHGSILIHCFKERPVHQIAHDAQFIYDSITEKYDMGNEK